MTNLVKRGSTIFLRIAVSVISLIVLALCIFALPAMGRGMAQEFPSIPYLNYSIFIGYTAAIPFFIAVFHAFKILNYIDKDKAFSELSVKALNNIKYCAVTISVLFGGGQPFIYFIAQADDAPGLVVIGMMIVMAPLVIAVFAAVLQKLLQNAIDLKSENELTV